MEFIVVGNHGGGVVSTAISDVIVLKKKPKGHLVYAWVQGDPFRS